MSDLQIDIPRARELVSQLFDAAVASRPALRVTFPDSPGVVEFNRALSAALEATSGRNTRLTEDVHMLVDATLRSIESIVHLDNSLVVALGGAAEVS